MHGLPYNPLDKRCLAVDACPTAVCNCKTDESCEIKYRTCFQCDVVTCISNSKPQSGSISGGAVAGAVVSCVVVSILFAGALWFLRRRRAARKAQVLASKRPTAYTVEGAMGTPAGEKPPTIPASPRTPNANDTRSVHSGTSSHVIPIAYVPPNSASMSLADGHSRSAHLSMSSLPPSRPHRSPELNLKLEPPKSAASRLSGQGLHPPRFSSPYAASQRSGMSRASTISSVGSFIYGDTPVVVSQAQGGVRQVLGVARPEVVQVPASGLGSGPPTPGSGTGADLVRSFSQRSIKKSGASAPPLPDFPPEHISERSPFSPESELGADPFADKENETANYSVHSAHTFGQPGVPGRDIRASKSPPPTSSTFLTEPLGYDIALGMSTFSSASGISSSGLEAFPFQFGPADGAPRDSLDTNADVELPGKKVARASLDTLALSRDVEAFPLPESAFSKRP
ncbi:hypothetical protein RSAG8_01533, partial [Rhizoctonia solani AG-8 WAC10335]